MESEIQPQSLPNGDSSVKLRRELSVIDAISILVGSVVGAGIFTTPGVILAQTGSVGEGLLAWTVAGGVALCSVLLYAELGSSIPVASGEAEFYKETFGPSLSFAFIWTTFWVLFPGTIAILGSCLSQYFLAAIINADFTPQDLDGDERVKYIAITCVVGLTIYNCAGARSGSILQNLLNLCKATLVLVLVAVAVLFLTRDTTVLQSNFRKAFMGSSLSGFGPGMVAALWAYSGFGNIVFLTEELKNPSRDVPLAAIGSVIVVLFTYLLVNLSYLSVLPLSDMQASITVAMDMTKAGLGQDAGSLTATLVALSLLGNLNSVVFCGGRYLYSATRDGLSYGRFLGKLNQHSSAPINALAAQGVWCVLVLLQSTSLVKLLNYLSISIQFFTGLTAIAHWKLRRQCPELSRPFKVPLHPWLNVVVLSSSLYITVTSISRDPRPTLLSLIVVLASFPVYYFLVKKKDLGIDVDHENTPLLGQSIS